MADLNKLLTPLFLNEDEIDFSSIIKKFLGKEYYGIIRTTVLINEKGKIVKIWSNVRVKDHVKNVINELSKI